MITPGFVIFNNTKEASNPYLKAIWLIMNLKINNMHIIQQHAMIFIGMEVATLFEALAVHLPNIKVHFSNIKQALFIQREKRTFAF